MSAVFKLTYGLFVLTAKDGEKDNGCIINTALQVTANPLQVSICVNKDNYTHVYYAVGYFRRCFQTAAA